MPSHSERRDLPYTPEQMFALVADVAKYPEFLPWVVGARVKSDSETEMVADLLVGFRGLREQFTSRVLKKRPGHITIDYLDGPLKHLHNDWFFSPNDSGGGYVDFRVDFAFRNRMFERLAGQMFANALSKMTSAFVARADSIYAAGSGSSSSSAHSAA